MSRAEDTRFDSWKEIAVYLGRDLRTVRRWEQKRGLPVYRIPGGGRASVYANRNEIDAWLQDSAARARAEISPSEDDTQTTALAGQPLAPRWRVNARRVRWALFAAAVIASCVLAATPFIYRSAGSSNGEKYDPPPAALTTGAAIAKAVIRKDQASLRLPDGKMCIFGMATDGDGPATVFAQGQYMKATNAAGQLGAALAYGSVADNSFTTQSKTHLIGGVSVSGVWDSLDVFSGSNQQSGAPFASVHFTVSSDSLVVIIGIASGQQYVTIDGLPEALTDEFDGGVDPDAMIIVHRYLPAGTYSVTENSSAVPGRAPEKMADLIGVFVFGSQNGSAPAGAVLPASARRKGLEVTSESQCVALASTSSEARPLGTIHIVSGDGVFSGVTSTHKIVSVRIGALLTGSVILRALNLGPAWAMVPLIETPSWGEPETSWRLVQNIHPGESIAVAPIIGPAPLQPGEYHILFAFNMERNGSNVASGTNWARGLDVWRDGNDVAQFDDARIRQAQQFGCVIDWALTVGGHRMDYLPADAITLEVN